MQIITWNDFLQNGLSKPASMTVGIFDGVHLGHQALISQIVSHNAENIPVVITFKENYKTENPANNIQSFREKAAKLESFGVEILIVIDFTESFKNMAGITFLETLLEHGNIGFFAVGDDFRCGCHLDTDAAAIKNFFTSRGIQTEIVPQVMHDGLPISSSRIRVALAAGDTELAEAMLGV